LVNTGNPSLYCQPGKEKGRDISSILGQSSVYSADNSGVAAGVRSSQMHRRTSRRDKIADRAVLLQEQKSAQGCCSKILAAA
jgi:hypothetical protein